MEPIQEPQFSSEAKKAKTFSFWKLIKRLFISVFVFFVLIVSASVLLVVFYEDDVKAIVIDELNKHLKTEVIVEPHNIQLTIIKTFPECALEFKKITIKEVTNKDKKDTLIYAESFSLLFNVKDLLNKNYTIKHISIEDAQANLKIDKNGNENYKIWESTDTIVSKGSLKFELSKISIDKLDLKYRNAKTKLKIESKIKQLQFKGLFHENDFSMETKGDAYLKSFSVDKVNYISQKQVKLDVKLNVTGSHYQIAKSDVYINKTHLISNGSFDIQDKLDHLKITFNAQNLDISSSLSLLPEEFQKEILDYKSEGTFYANGSLNYNSNKPFELKSEFGIKNADITYIPKNTTITDVNLIGSVEINEKRTVLKLSQIQAVLNTNSFSGDVELSNFKNPYLKVSVNANTKLEELISFYPIDTLEEVSGKIILSASIEGLIADMKANVYNPNISAKGDVTLENLHAKFIKSPTNLHISQGNLSLNQRNVSVSDLKMKRGNSDITLVGEMPNFLSYMFDSQTPLTILANVKSDNIELEDFIFKPTATSKSDASISLSSAIQLKINLNAKQLSFGKFKASNINGGVFVKDQKVAVQNLSLTSNDGQIELNALADATGEFIKVSGHSELKNINVQKLFYQLNNFGQNTIQDQNLKGYITSTVDFSANWDKQLNIDLSSVKSTADILIERGELINLKSLESLAKYIDVNELKQIKFSSMQVHLDIANQLITIPKTSIKSSALNLELWGTHSFNNQIDYHIQLLISELLAKKPRRNKELDEELALVENDPENRRSVFIVMSGSIDNPTIKYDKKGAKEKIKEDIKQEKQTIKQILNEEFGWFKKDSVKTNATNKSDQKFDIQFGDEKPKPNKPLQPKKKEDDDEDF
jgi:hypothetical protein